MGLPHLIARAARWPVLRQLRRRDLAGLGETAMSERTRALNVTEASPEGQLRHFWVPATAMSTPQRSTATSQPPKVTTASVIRSASWA